MFERIVLPPASICFPYLDNTTLEGKGLPLVLVRLYHSVLWSSVVLQRVPKGLHLEYRPSDKIPLYLRNHSMSSSLLDPARDLCDQSLYYHIVLWAAIDQAIDLLVLNVLDQLCFLYSWALVCSGYPLVFFPWVISGSIPLDLTSYCCCPVVLRQLVNTLQRGKRGVWIGVCAIPFLGPWSATTMCSSPWTSS